MLWTCCLNLTIIKDHWNIQEGRGRFNPREWKITLLKLITHTYLFFYQHQEPITQSFQLPYLPSASTLSHIFLFSEAPPTGFFACVYIIANHKRAVVIYCLCHMQVTWKYINNGKKHGKSACFHRKLKNPSHISVLKLKRYGTGLTEGCNWFGSSK